MKSSGNGYETLIMSCEVYKVERKLKYVIIVTWKAGGNKVSYGLVL